MKTLLIPTLLAMSITGLQAPAQNLKYGPASAPKGASQPIDEIGLVVNDEAITRRQLTQEMEAARRNPTPASAATPSANKCAKASRKNT